MPTASKAARRHPSKSPSAALQFIVMAVVRCAMDAGLVCPSSVGSRELAPAMSSMSIQGSALSLCAAFLFAQGATLIGKGLQFLVSSMLFRAARLSSSSFVWRHVARRWPAQSQALSWLTVGTLRVVSTLAGLMALLPLPMAACGLAHGLDALTQRAQRLHTPALWVLAQRCSGRQPRGVAPQIGQDVTYKWEVPEDLSVPLELCCPITLQLLHDPVLLHGDVFERVAMEAWLRRSSRHPLRADVAADLKELRPAQEMALVCQEFAREHGLSAVRDE